jgi:MATE family multidrug resistance protein
MWSVDCCDVTLVHSGHIGYLARVIIAEVCHFSSGSEVFAGTFLQPGRARTPYRAPSAGPFEWSRRGGMVAALRSIEAQGTARPKGAGAGGFVDGTDDRALEVPDLSEAPDRAPAPSEHAPVAPLEPMTQRRVLGLATPIIGENLLHTLVGAVDTFLVARLGAAAVAGVGTGFEFVFFIIAILSAIDIGATVLVSQAIGAGEQERADYLARQAIVWGLVLSVPVSIGMFFGAPTIIGLFGTEPDVADAAITYLRIIAATSVTLLLSFVCGAVLRGAGDSRTPLAAAAIANIVNVAVAYTLILGHFGFPRLEVAGSATGAAAGRAIGAAFMLIVMVYGTKAISLRGKWGWRPKVKVARELLTLGVPAALEQVLSSGGFMTLLAVVALIGTPALAAQQIAFTALSTAFLPGIAFSIAVTALVGQSIGAGVPADARTAWRISLRWAVGWLAVGGALVFVFAGWLMEIFSDDREVIAAGESALHALGLQLPFWAIWFVSSGGLRGSGDTRTPMVIGASTIWFGVFLAWIGVRWFDGGLGWVWTAFAIAVVPPCIWVGWIFRQRMHDYESGGRPLPTVSTAPVH